MTCRSVNFACTLFPLFMARRLSDRVYLMKVKSEDSVDEVVREVDSLASKKGYSKIIAKVPKVMTIFFLSCRDPN